MSPQVYEKLAHYEQNFHHVEDSPSAGSVSPGGVHHLNGNSGICNEDDEDVECEQVCLLC